MPVTAAQPKRAWSLHRDAEGPECVGNRRRNTCAAMQHLLAELINKLSINITYFTSTPVAQISLPVSAANDCARDRARQGQPQAGPVGGETQSKIVRGGSSGRGPRFGQASEEQRI